MTLLCTGKSQITNVEIHCVCKYMLVVLLVLLSLLLLLSAIIFFFHCLRHHWNKGFLAFQPSVSLLKISIFFRIIFLGLVTCLSGSSYFFIIAVIIILRRQFHKSEREIELQHKKASKEIELQAPSKPNEDQPSTLKTPKVTPRAPEVSVRIVAELEEGREVYRSEPLAQDGRDISTNNTEEQQQLKSPTETPADFTAIPGEEAKMEMDEQKSEEEGKEECQEIIGGKRDRNA